jgi:tetratricopeptide (TPR) repeat protein
MSGGNDKKADDIFGDGDWDNALDEWEKNTFVPVESVVAPVEPSPGATLHGQEQAEQGLVGPDDDDLTRIPGEVGSNEGPDGHPILGDAVEVDFAPQTDEIAAARHPQVARPHDEDGTVVARSPLSSPPAKSKGGLGQLFARKSNIPAPLPPPGPRPGGLTGSLGKAASVPRVKATPLVTPAPLSPLGVPAAPPAPRFGNLDEETEVFTSAAPAPKPTATSLDDNEPTGFFTRSSAPPPRERPEVPRSPLREDSVTTRLDSETISRVEQDSLAQTHADAEHAQQDEPDAETASVQEVEVPLPSWMDAGLGAELRASARWLSEEGVVADTNEERLRVHLAASELWAILGDHTHARTAAENAHAAAPAHALAARQRRQLGPKDEDYVMSCLREEAESADTPAGRASAQLILADMARVLGDSDAMIDSLRRACSYDPSDVRAPALLAAQALASNDHTSPFLTVEVTELGDLGTALARALEIREVEGKGQGLEKPSPNYHFFRAKMAYATRSRSDVMEAVTALRQVPELELPAAWLSAAIGATDTPTRKRSTQSLFAMLSSGASEARAALLLRAAELSDPDVAARAFAPPKPQRQGGDDDTDVELDTSDLQPDTSDLDGDRLALVALQLLPRSEFLPDSQGTRAPFEAALVAAVAGAISREPRNAGVIGSAPAHAPVRLARAIARHATQTELDNALAAANGDPSSKAVALEFATRAGRLSDVAETLVDWTSGSTGTSQGGLGPALVGALLSERASDKQRAAVAYNHARSFAAGSDGLLRIVAAVDNTFDLPFALDSASEQAPTPQASAIMRLEAAERARRAGGDPAELLLRAHQADASLGVPSFLLQRGARRRGDVDDVLKWVGERAKLATDPLESAIETVREALFLSDRDADASREKLESAHATRPDDFALRELLERLWPQPSHASAEWRAKHALNAVGPARATRFIEAAMLSSGDDARRYAKEAASSGDSLARSLLEHAEIAGGDIGRLTEQLLEHARAGTDVVVRREAYERLADMEQFVAKEGSTRDAWFKAILDREPLHMPSLRALEHFYLGQGSDAELEPVAEKIAYALGGKPGGECAAHAQLAARLKLRGGMVDFEGTRPLVELSAQQPEPPLWAIRAKNAHARVTRSMQAILDTSTTLADRTTRTGEVAALLRRASESALELGRAAPARELLERAANEDAGDCVTWGLLAAAREGAQDPRGSAEACEALARTSNVQGHQLLAWYDAAKLWLDVVGEEDRGVAALEAAAKLDVAYEDVFSRLSSKYAARRNDAELAELLSARLERATDPDERVTLEVDRARALVDIGDLEAAGAALRQALEARPDHTTALSAYADLCEKTQQWNDAEQAWVRLARLLPTPAEQRVIYERLGVLYSKHAPNLARAEVALKEVLKRAPKDLSTLLQLVDVYRQKNDSAHAAEVMLELVGLAEDEETRLSRLIALAEIHENVGKELRKAEQVLEGARKEFPTSVVALRALAEFYSRQKQIPAMHILLDRAASDARRAFAGGRLVTSLFQILATAYELRGKRDAANVVAATLAALEGGSSKVRGAEMRAFDPRLDDLLAPEVLGAGLRSILAQAGDALDLAAPVDLRALRANTLPQGNPVFTMANAIASTMGISGLNVLVSPALGRVCVPCGSNPPMIVIGEGLLTAQNDRAKAFVLSRALKSVQTRSSSLVRVPAQEMAILLFGWLSAFNPGWKPPGVNAQALEGALRRLQPVMPRVPDPSLGTLALEIAANLGQQALQVGAAATAWSNRAALLAIGDPTAAVEAIAWTTGLDKAPSGAEERAAWVARTVEARELLVFSVSDPYSEARSRLGLDR